MKLLVLLIVVYIAWRLFDRYRPRAIRRDVSRLEVDDDEEALASASEVIKVDGGPLKLEHRRLALRDRRLLPKPKIDSTAWPRPKRPKVMALDEATRLFAGTLRTKNRNLRDLRTDDAQLARYGLPLWKSEADVAAALKISVPRLRHFSVHREKERVSHYIRFAIPKRNGGERIILAPKRELKSLQRKLHASLVSKLPVSEYAHGFRVGKSIATHAAPHVGKKVVIRLDIKDFFPSLHVGRVRGLLIALGYSYPVAATLAVLMTESVRQPVDLAGEVFHVPVSSRHAAQGAPTSPGLANAIATPLDRRVAGLAKKLGFVYTRYADDLTFSGDDIASARHLIKSVQRIAHAEGFTLNDAKTRVLTQRGAQIITGVTVNRSLGISRRERRKLRVALYQARTRDAPESTWRKLKGKLSFIAMLNTEQARVLRNNGTGS